MTRQSVLSVLVMGSPDRGGVTRSTARLAAALRDLHLTDPHRGAEIECLARARIDLLRLTERCHSRPPEELCGLDGMEVHPGVSRDEKIDFWVAATDVMVMPPTPASRSGVRNSAMEEMCRRGRTRWMSS